MKNNILTRPRVLGGLTLLLSLSVALLVIRLSAADTPSVSATNSAQLAKDMVGTSVLVGQPGKVGEIPAAGGRLKFRTGKHWTMTQSDSETGRVVMHDGGTYTLEGDRYTETIAYANASTAGDIGKTFMFTVKVEGDTMTQIGVGNPYTEVWKRLK